jgi:hypothetical protein
VKRDVDELMNMLWFQRSLRINIGVEVIPFLVETWSVAPSVA